MVHFGSYIICLLQVLITKRVAAWFLTRLCILMMVHNHNKLPTNSWRRTRVNTVCACSILVRMRGGTRQLYTGKNVHSRVLFVGKSSRQMQTWRTIWLCITNRLTFDDLLLSFVLEKWKYQLLEMHTHFYNTTPLINIKMVLCQIRHFSSLSKHIYLFYFSSYDRMWSFFFLQNLYVCYAFCIFIFVISIIMFI